MSSKKAQQQRAADLRELAKYERETATLIEQLLNKQASLLAEKYQENGDLLAYDFDVLQDRITKSLSDKMIDTFKRFSELTSKRIGRQLKQTLAEQEAVRWAETHAAGQIANISQTTKTRVQAVILHGIDQGLSVPAISKTIAATLKDVNKSRAIRIARTETHKAANYGSLSSASNSGLPTKKTWVAKLDNRTRDAHRLADDQTVDVNEPFIVDGYQLKFPGDGPPGQSINCRCTVTYSLKQ